MKGGEVKDLNNYLNEYFLLCLTIHNCVIACKPFGTPKFFHELQIYLNQHGCASTRRTGVYRGLEASAGDSLEKRKTKFFPMIRKFPK